MKKSVLIESQNIIKLLRNYNNRFIVEAPKLKDLIKFGISSDTAQLFDEIMGKKSIWMVNLVIDYFSNLTGEDRRTIASKITPTLELRSNLVGIMDYITTELGGNIIKLKEEKKTYQQILDLAEKWHNDLKKGSGKFNYNEENIILDEELSDGEYEGESCDFRDENGIGYYWTDLDTSNSEEECERMGHCGRSNYGTLFSLRSYRKDSNSNRTVNESHLTASIDKDDGILYQLKGEHNSKPNPKYHKYILPLFYVQYNGDYLIRGFGTEYSSQDDFKLEDLPLETLKTLYEDRSELFRSRGLQEKMKELGIEIEVDPYPSEFNVTEYYFNNIHNLIDNDPEVGTKEVDNRWSKYKVSVHLSEALLAYSFEYFSDYINGLEEYPDWDSAVNLLSEENKNKILELLNRIYPSDETSIEQTSFIGKIKKDDDITNIIYDAMYDVFLENASEKYYDSLMSTLSYYGDVTVDGYNNSIEINGDLSNFVDMESDEVAEAFKNVEKEYGYENVDMIFFTLIDNDTIDRPSWEHPKLTLNTTKFNEVVKLALMNLEKRLLKENYRDYKIVNLLKEYNKKYTK